MLLPSCYEDADQTVFSRKLIRVFAKSDDIKYNFSLRII